MSYNWNFEVVLQSLPLFIKGAKYTILVTAISMAFGLILGLFISQIRLSQVKLVSRLAQFYIEFFRGTPILMQLLWVYYSLPILTGVTLSSFNTAIIALSLNLGAFIAEIFRAGIQSIGRDQREAGFAIGMTSGQVMRRIILPQAVRRIIPPLGSTWVSLFKDTALVSVIVVPEIMYQASVLSIETYRPVEIYTVVALLYFFLTYPQSRLVDIIYSRLRVKN